jgi:hypothetical protein
MFCWPCIVVYQYSETNVTYFLFSLLRIKGLYMFRALLAYPQEVLHKRHLVHCMRFMSVGCTRVGVLILRRRYTNSTWYIAFVLCQLAAPGLEFSSSGGATQTAIGILRACYVSWLHQGWNSHPQEVLHKRHLVYCMRVMSAN